MKSTVSSSQFSTPHRQPKPPIIPEERTKRLFSSRRLSSNRQPNWAQQFASTFLDRMQCCSATAMTDLKNVTDEADDSIYHVEDDTIHNEAYYTTANITSINSIACNDDDDDDDDDDDAEEVFLSPSTPQPHSSTSVSSGLNSRISFQHSTRGDRRRLLGQIEHQLAVDDRYSRRPSKSQLLESTTNVTDSGATQSSSSSNQIFGNIMDRACCSHPVGIPAVRRDDGGKTHEKKKLRNPLNDTYENSNDGTAPTLPLCEEEAEDSQYSSNDPHGNDQEEIRSSATTQVISHRTVDFGLVAAGLPVKVMPVWIPLEEERQDQEEEQAYRCLMRLERPNKKVQR
ncbi:hypothetical protein IV203_030207 [Nitzschia inconspicua]|uniref:Uncharacterized protein n=1 Tax=Nitzschia inconspicua TaxID=303405 RepID=A0A9K3LUY2_9STRA|nr:hypothetical protein IV203_030207 [Nitzschia inconspicua]